MRPRLHMASARNRDKGDQDGRVLDLTGALADPTRLALYQDLVSADVPVTVKDLARIASSLGLHPETSSVSESESRIEIRNCVFSELVDEYPELICPLHTAMLRGIAEEHFPGCDIDTHTGPDAKNGPCSLTIKAQAIATLRPGA